jgi:hypothetical protein
VLQDEALVLDGITFYGSPWTPPFMLWHFMAEEDRLAMLYRMIQKGSTIFYNVAACDEGYKLINQPRVFEV